jgi:hypothetical protein
MDRSAANRVLADSFARPCATPCTWRADRDAYITEQQQALRRAQIDPIPVQGVAMENYQQHFGADNVVRNYFAIAREDDVWLLYSPETGNFAKGYGSDTSQPLGLLAFSSEDALAEWLG